MRSKLHLGSKKIKAFTLVELSIVIVIIGLIVSGVTAGKSLVRQAKLRSVVSDFLTFQTSINSFKLQYNGYPGDIPNATSFFTTGTVVNGNNNKVMNWQTLGNTTNVEDLQFWKQLSAAGIMPGNYVGWPNGPSRSVPVSSVPPGAMGGGYGVYSYSMYIPFSSNNSGINKIIYGSVSAGASCVVKFLSAAARIQMPLAPGV